MKTIYSHIPYVKDSYTKRDIGRGDSDLQMQASNKPLIYTKNMLLHGKPLCFHWSLILNPQYKYPNSKMLKYYANKEKGKFCFNSELRRHATCAW